MTEKEKKKESGGVSRRDFLKDAGLLVGGTAIGSTVLLAACGGGEGETVTKTATATKTVTSTAGGGTTTVTITKTVEVPGPGVAAENVISLNVNGKAQTVQVDSPEVTLNYLLRDKLGLTSIKDMCLGYGACGSCSIIMDGRPVLSCMLLAIECNGATIETAEGIADANHSLINAYIKHHCMQCGYCTPGFIVTAKALLDHNPNPSEEKIRDIMGGNICRCGTYPQHILAVQEAAESL
ncbi:(2Fe-2S)-binding protein [Chloroflexota bacterium]